MRTPLLALVAVIASSSGAWAQFVPGPDPVTGTVGAQSISGGTGTVSSTGTITIGGGGTNSVTLTTTSGTTTINNSGNILQTGTGRTIRNNTSGTPTFAINNLVSTALIRSADGDTIRADVAGSNWTVNNSGTLQSLNASAGGSQAIDFDAVTTGTVSITNNATGQILASAADAIRPGANAVIINAGTITATPLVSGAPSDASSSDGIDTQLRSGVNVTNSGSISGRHGITGGDAAMTTYAITVTNNAGTVAGLNGSGINIDGVFATVTANVSNAFGATFKGGVLPGVTNADGDGIDVDGVLTLNNSGDVLGLGAKGASNPEGLAIGGGSITNTATGRIIGSGLAADAPNGDPTKTGNGILADDSSGGDAVAATTITNSGLIEGKGGFAITMISGGSGLGGNVRTFNNSITNNSGGIIRVTDTPTSTGVGAAVRTGNGNDTIINRGAISSGSNGLAIDMQGGNDLLRIEGGVASITGNIDGGAGTNTFELAPGAGNAFSYGGVIANFALVHIQSGSVMFSGANTYTGTTRISGGLLTLNGAGRLSTSSALELGGGTLRVSNVNGPDGQVFASLALTASSTIDLDFNTSLTFNALTTVGGGTSLAILHYDATDSPNYAIRFLNDLTGDPTFLALAAGTTINGAPAKVTFDGTFTNLAAVPEPCSLMLLGVGALGVFRVVRRRRA